MHRPFRISTGDDLQRKGYGRAVTIDSFSLDYIDYCAASVLARRENLNIGTRSAECSSIIMVSPHVHIASIIGSRRCARWCYEVLV